MSRLSKAPSESQTVMTQLVIPNDANALGNLMGGRLLHMIDIVGAMAASRHANCPVVTAHINEVNFREPVKIGDIVELCAKLVWVGNTSMEVKVDIFREDITTGQRMRTNDARLVFVALDSYGKPRQVPLLTLQTEQEQREFEEAAARHNKK